MSCPSPEVLARLADGELAVNEARAVEAHVATCASCRAAQERLQSVLAGLATPSVSTKSDAAFLQEVMAQLDQPPSRSAAEARSAPGASSSSWSRLWGRLIGGPRWAPLVLAAAAVVLVAVPVVRHAGAPGPDGRSQGEGMQARGEALRSLGQRARADILVVREHALRGLAPDAADEALLPEDGLAVRVTNLVTDGPVYLLAFAWDAAGAVHWLYPAYLDARDDPAALKLEPGTRDKLLGEVMGVDEIAPGDVRLVTVLSTKVRHVKEVEALLAGARRGTPSPLSSPSLVAPLFPGDVTCARTVRREARR